MSNPASLFGAPTPVVIDGLPPGMDTMEPALDRDGSCIFFNTSNAKPNPDIEWAEKIGASNCHFKLMGKVGGVDSPGMEVVASIDLDGNLYFISPRVNPAPGEPLQTIWTGRFKSGQISDLAQVEGVAIKPPPTIIIDAEISAGGLDLYYAESTHTPSGPPAASKIMLACKLVSGSFVPLPSSDVLFQNINLPAPVIQYAPSTSVDQLTMCFTRYDNSKPSTPPSLWLTTRTTIHAPWDSPIHLSQASGYVEGGSISGDGKRIVYHHRNPATGLFELLMISRP